MLGTLRFILAIMVMISHYPLLALKFNIGVMAVVMFYTLSGYYMNRSYQRFKQHTANPARAFYLDRVIKIMPIYLIMVVLTFAVLHFVTPSQSLAIMQHDLSAISLLLNTLLIPVNYVFEPLSIGALQPHPYVPPAWSLATEMHFYLLVPLLFLLPIRILKMILLASLSLQLFAISALNPWPIDTVSYRYLPGVLVFFITGMLLASTDSAAKTALLQAYILWLVMLILVLPIATLNHTWQLEIWLTALLAPVIIRSVSSSRILTKVWDQRLGDLAYPIFISHFFVFLLVDHYANFADGTSWVFSLLFTLALSSVLMMLQAKLEHLRIRIRGFQSMKKITS